MHRLMRRRRRDAVCGVSVCVRCVENKPRCAISAVVCCSCASVKTRFVWHYRYVACNKTGCAQVGVQPPSTYTNRPAVTMAATNRHRHTHSTQHGGPQALSKKSSSKAGSPPRRSMRARPTFYGCFHAGVACTLEIPALESSTSPSDLSVSLGYIRQNVSRSSLRSQSQAGPPAMASTTIGAFGNIRSAF